MRTVLRLVIVRKLIEALASSWIHPVLLCLQPASSIHRPNCFLVFRNSCCNFFVTKTRCQSVQSSPCQPTAPLMQQFTWMNSAHTLRRQLSVYQRECQVDLTLYGCERVFKWVLSISMGPEHQLLENC